MASFTGIIISSVTAKEKKLKRDRKEAESVDSVTHSSFIQMAQGLAIDLDHGVNFDSCRGAG